MKRLLILGLIAGGAVGAAAVITQWPEIRRYLNVRKM